MAYCFFNALAPGGSTRRFALRVLGTGWLLASCSLPSAWAQATNSSPLFSSPSPQPLMPEAGPSLLRVLGALAVVIGLFLGCVWVYRNGRHMVFRQGRAPRLNILETRSLGSRQAIYVVGYDRERFLLASSPAGISLISRLVAEGEAGPQPAVAPQPPTGVENFAQTLTRVLKGQPPIGPSGESKP